jgi:hypothetical protein
MAEVKVDLSPGDIAKKAAAEKLIEDLVFDGAVIGVGTGSTTAFALKRLADKVRSDNIKVNDFLLSVLWLKFRLKGFVYSNFWIGFGYDH